MIGYQDKINQILRGAETIKNMNMDNFYGKDVPEVKSTTTSTFRYNDDALVDAKTINAYIEELEEVKLERDALWVKTQEDERIINDLNDAVKEKKRQRDEAIELVKELMPFAAFDLDNDRFGLITELQTRFEELMLEVS